MRRAGLIVALLAVTLAVWRSAAWLTADAWFCLRVVENLATGHGLRWNADERLQVFTDPLWVLLLAVPRLLGLSSPEGARLASLGCTLGLVAVVAVRTSRAHGTVAVGWLALVLASRTLVDWTSSGLETPLTFLLLGGLLGPGAPRSTLAVALAVGLLGVDRLDLVLLALPALGVAIVGDLRHGRRGAAVARDLALGLAPLAAWLAFAVIWFGAPLPNAWFAKVANGIPGDVKRALGLHYLGFTLRTDPVAGFLLVGAALAAALDPRDRARRLALVVGAALQLAYTAVVGGDYLLGRFVAPPTLLATLVLADVAMGWSAPRVRAFLVAALAVLVASAAVPGSALRRAVLPPDPPWPVEDGVFDDVGERRPPGGLALWGGARPAAPWPDGVVVVDAVDAREGQAGPGVHLVDTFAIGDALLARLPSTSSGVGHHDRVVPLGYVEALEGRGAIVDPDLRAYAAHLARLGRAPLWDPARWRSIVHVLLVEPLAPVPDRRAPWDPHEVIGPDGRHLAWCREVTAAGLGAPKADGHPVEQPDVLHQGGQCPVLVTALPAGDALEVSLSVGAWDWAWVDGDRRLAEGTVDVAGPAGTLTRVRLDGARGAGGLWLSRPGLGVGIGHVVAAP